MIASQWPQEKLSRGQANVAIKNVSRKTNWFDTLFVYFGLVVYCDALSATFRAIRGDAAVQDPGVSDPVSTVSQTLILVILVYICIRRRERILPLLRYAKPYLMILLLCLMSTLWSNFPLVTFRRSITLGICVTFGVYCYDTFGLEKLGRMFVTLMLVLGVLSVITYIALPSIGRDSTIIQYEAMRGVFSQKNSLADNMVIAVAGCGYQFIQDRKGRAFLLRLGLLMGCIVLSRSVSAMMIGAILIAMTGLFAIQGRLGLRMVYLYVVLSLSAVLLSVMILSPDLLFIAAGRDPSMTGRVPLWHLVIANIAERPILGSGYGGFWNGDSRVVQDIWNRIGWEAPGAHNGWLDIGLDLGITGITLFGWLYISTIWTAYQANNSRTLPTAKWILLFMMTDVMLNFDEGSMLLAGIPIVLLAAAMVEVRAWNDRRRTQRPQRGAAGRRLRFSNHAPLPAWTGHTPVKQQRQIKL